ncbi:MAG: hypothetical protein PHS48_10395, partial [Bacteroidales bacterium]|nr:hypothetical protein [Bacteroidales bacterium]
RMAFLLYLIFPPLEMFTQAVRMGIGLGKPLNDTVFTEYIFIRPGKIIFPFLMLSHQRLT